MVLSFLRCFCYKVYDCYLFTWKYLFIINRLTKKAYFSLISLTWTFLDIIFLDWKGIFSKWFLVALTHSFPNMTKDLIILKMNTLFQNSWNFWCKSIEAFITFFMWLGAKELRFVLLKLHETNERVLLGLVLQLKTEFSN